MSSMRETIAMRTGVRMDEDGQASGHGRSRLIARILHGTYARQTQNGNYFRPASETERGTSRIRLIRGRAMAKQTATQIR